MSLTGVAFTDTLPANVVVATPANAATTCGGGVLTASPGTGTVSLANATMAHDSSCTVTFDAIASPATAFVDATRTNTIATVSNVQGALTTSFSATVRVQAGAQVAKAFSPSTISNGGVATLTLTLRNFNATPLTPLDITDALPAGMTIASPAAAATTCPGGAVTATPGGASLSLSGGTLAAAPTGAGSTACTVSVNVTAANTGTTPLTLNNAVLAGNFGGVNYAATSAALVVNPVTVISGSKAFSPNSRVQTQVTTLTITLTNASGTPAGITSVTDNLTTMGTGFTVAASPPAATTTCGGTVTASPGTTAITMAGGSIPAHGSCQIIVPVQVGATASTGTRTNTIAVGAIQTDQGSNGTTITANLSVSAALAVSKAFVPATVTTGGVTRLTITLTHANGAPALSNIAVTDTLPAGHVISPTPNATTTCGGTVTATAGSGSVSLAGGALAAGSTSCQIQVNVTVPTSVPSGSSAQATNTIAANAVTTAEGVTNAGAASATITRTLAFLTLGKSFSPLAVEPGIASTMTITIVNTNTGAISLTGVNLTDVFPLGLVVANPPNAGLTGVDCTGIVSAPVGATALGLSGGTIAAGARCELKVNVTPTAVGNLVNILPPGVITTAQGPTNLSQVVATLAATGRADVRVQKTPSVPNVAPGGTVIYTITVSNAGPDNIAGALFTDPVPAGVTFTAWTCAAPAGAACTAAGSGAISDSVTIPKGSSVVYTVTAVVAPTSTGSITNTATVDVPSLVVDPDESNNSATTTTPITPPVLTLTKSATPASFVVGTPASYTIAVVNTRAPGDHAGRHGDRRHPRLPDARGHARGVFGRGQSRDVHDPGGPGVGGHRELHHPGDADCRGTGREHGLGERRRGSGLPADGALPGHRDHEHRRGPAPREQGGDPRQLRGGRPRELHPHGVQRGHAGDVGARHGDRPPAGVTATGGAAQRLRGRGTAGDLHDSPAAAGRRGGRVRHSGDAHRERLPRQHGHREWRWRPDLPGRRARSVSVDGHHGRRRAAAAHQQAGGAGELRRERRCQLHADGGERGHGGDHRREHGRG